MNAILTSTKRIGKELKIVAKSASGKSVTVKPVTFSESEHHQAAINLSIKLGWGHTLVGGETKEGFAYIPIQQEPAKQLSTEELIDRVAKGCSQLTPNSQDPIRFAAGVETLAKLQTPKS